MPWFILDAWFILGPWMPSAYQKIGEVVTLNDTTCGIFPVNILNGLGFFDIGDIQLSKLVNLVKGLLPIEHAVECYVM
jgi:hypothetical protein